MDVTLTEFFDNSTDTGTLNPSFNVGSSNEEVSEPSDYSLSAYITKKIQELADVEANESDASDSNVFGGMGDGGTSALIAAVQSANASSDKAPIDNWLQYQDPAALGNQLIGFDRDLYGGLEQYLPTPEIRFQTSRHRILASIKELEGRLNKYRKLSHPSPELKQQIQQLEYRLIVLKGNEAQIEENLGSIYRFVQPLIVLSDIFDGMSRKAKKTIKTLGLKIMKLYDRLTGSQTVRQRQSMDELQALGWLVEDEMNKPMAHRQEMANLLARYETVMHKTQAMYDVQAAKPKLDVWRRLGSFGRNAGVNLDIHSET